MRGIIADAFPRSQGVRWGYPSFRPHSIRSLGEQAGPKELVSHAVRAEAAGFDHLVASEHYYPWLDSQGHSPYTWSVLGAVAHATSRAALMSFVTCPIRRYHPAVVVQKASTIGVLSDGRFTLGLGAGENLNEHVVGGWPHVEQRHEMFEEALQIIRPLLNGETLTFSGNHFDVAPAGNLIRPGESRCTGCREP
ncbi:TIGR03557 family F420-dependent LLM class oxidoreductase [Micromonospora sp. 4G57]|uniref:TIGR03557 family F420-dependent LLM class oxidoreductase n=1 Tax=Micromonospora sicca TaxID=2202420 RepID=A0ABU5JMN9_9ACTN|nr:MULTISPECIES: TIGR03557 family F420-dependent LLM class oxidoreductase [unclassified Micromonospora]MDZ5446987.1 TIGR03557 family F420-dependent LLM class oxidoreductase [Micromonospora sp. 4G57]MDZ5493664.1 TIGR03557 family F420-dependent LLM class oxidoreductase [Micromonospora sp. 4G53]